MREAWMSHVSQQSLHERKHMRSGYIVYCVARYSDRENWTQAT